MKYEGAVTEINLLEKLLELANEKFTGAIRFENDAIIKIIYFKGGEVLSASTNDRSDSIDEILLKSNKVSREHIKQALAKRKESETLGDALLNLGFISKKELAWVRRIQLIGIMRSLIRWPEGTYTIVSDYLPKREEGTSFQLPQIVVEMIVTDEDRSSVEAELQGGAAVFELHPDAFEHYQELGLNEDADAIFASIDGRKSVSEIAGNSAMDAFSVYKLIRAFLLLGLIRYADGKPQETLEVLSAPAVPSEDWSLEDYEEPPAPALAAFPPGKPKTIEVPADEELLPSIDLGPIEDEPAVPPTPDQTVPLPSWESKPKPAARGGTTPGVIPTPPTRSTAPGSQRSSAPTFATATPKKRRSSSKLPLVVLAIVLLAAAGYGAWWWLNRPQPATVATAKRPVPKAEPGVIEEAPVPAPVVSTDTEATDTVMAPLPAPVLTTAPATTPTAVAAPVIAAPASPATPPAGSRDPKRAQFEAQARDYAAESASTRFAVQLAAVCEVSSLETSLSRGGASVWFVPAQIGNRSCFRVLWGRYPDRASANRGLSELPQFFRSGRPVVVEVSSVVKR